MTDFLPALQRSFSLADQARSNGDHPFGALLLVNGEVVAEALNCVNTTNDITAHAETELVRILQRGGRLALLAEGTVVASCEPCPMCVGAMFWAGSRHVVFGLSSGRLTDLATAPGTQRVGFTITAPEIGVRTEPAMVIDGPHLQDDAARAHEGFWVR